jgi:hypothetical protein
MLRALAGAGARPSGGSAAEQRRWGSGGKRAALRSPVAARVRAPGRWGLRGQFKVGIDASACGPRRRGSPGLSEFVAPEGKKRKGETTETLAGGSKGPEGERETGRALGGGTSAGRWVRCGRQRRGRGHAVAGKKRAGEREKGAGPRVAHAGRERGGPGWKGERGGEECWAGLACFHSFSFSSFIFLTHKFKQF